MFLFNFLPSCVPCALRRAESSQKLPYVAPDALDKRGKALYGVPGPGQYEPATSFRCDGGAQQQQNRIFLVVLSELSVGQHPATPKPVSVFTSFYRAPHSIELQGDAVSSGALLAAACKLAHGHRRNTSRFKLLPPQAAMPLSLSARSGQADAGRQVFPAAPAFTVAARLRAPHKLHLAHQFDCLVPRWTSPGPLAYAAAPEVWPLLWLPVSQCGHSAVHAP